MARFALVPIILIVAAGGAVAQEDTAKVWNRAHQRIVEGALNIPGRMDISVEMSQSAKPAQAMTLVERAVLGSDAILVTVTQGGQMAPPARNGAPGKGGEPGNAGGGQPPLPVPGRLHEFSPFLEEVKASVQMEPQTQRGGGDANSALYTLKWKAEDGTAFSGTIAVSAASGSPLRIDAVGKSADSSISGLEVTMLFSEAGSATLPAAVQIRHSERTGMFASVQVSTNIRYSSYFNVSRPMEVRFTNLPNGKGM